MAEQPTGPVADLTFTDVAVRDPLTPVTRKERLYLLAVSMIGIAIVQTGLVPSKIATFGIELDKPDRSALLFLLALVTAYFLVAFIVYAASDYVAREKELMAAREREQSRLRYREVAIRLDISEEYVRRLYSAGELEGFASKRIGDEQAQQALRVLESPKFDLQMVRQALRSYPSELERNWRTMLTALARVFFEFFLPPIVGVYAIYVLLFRAFVVPETVASIATFGLIGLIAGILAKWMLPGPDPGGIIVTILIGIVGTFTGSFATNALLGGPWVLGINLISILVATLGAVTSLIIYRLLTRRVV